MVNPIPDKGREDIGLEKPEGEGENPNQESSSENDQVMPIIFIKKVVKNRNRLPTDKKRSTCTPPNSYTGRRDPRVTVTHFAFRLPGTGPGDTKNVIIINNTCESHSSELKAYQILKS